MTLADCIETLRKSGTIAEMTLLAPTLERPSATKDESRATLEALRVRLASNDHRAAVSTMLGLILLNADEMIGRMRRQGLLRASRNGFNAGGLRKAVTAALEVASLIHAPQERTEYLRSVLALLDMAPSAKQLQRSILERLKRRRGPGLKTLLAVVDTAFAKRWAGDREQPTTQWTFWSATELASAFSRLYMMTRDRLSIQYDLLLHTDDAASGDCESLYGGLLADAAALNELIDAEVLLDGLPYRAETGPRGVLVSSIDPDLERSVRFGYIQTDMQYAYREETAKEMSLLEPNRPSFETEVIKQLDAGLSTFVKLKNHPIQRIVIEVPSIPPVVEMLRTEGLFQEEIPMYEGACVDNFHSPEAGDLQVSDLLMATDILKVQRLFSLLQISLDHKLQKIEDQKRRYMLRLRSTVIVMRRENLVDLLSMILSSEQVEEFLSLTTLSADSSAPDAPDYIDLQYRPFVQSIASGGQYFACAPSVVSKSNLIRSVQNASTLRRRVEADKGPMQVAIVAALTQAGFLVREGVEFNIDGKRETDIFAFRDGALFVFECKSAYHPCSPHELRNSFDLIKTARKQLDIRAKWLAYPENQKRLLHKLAWDVPPTERVFTCVISANRVFAGYRYGTHPIRQAHELVNVLTMGVVGLGAGQPPLRFWRSDAFQIDDLIDYLNDQSIMARHHAALFPGIRHIPIGQKDLDFAQYGMDLELAVELMTQAFGKPTEPTASDGFQFSTATDCADLSNRQG